MPAFARDWYIAAEPYLHVRSPSAGCILAGDYAAPGAATLIAAAPKLLHELQHLLALLEPLEQSGKLDVPGLATLNGARAALHSAQVGDD